MARLRILSLDGGGYLGLASVACLESLERHFQTTCHEEFDLFCGTSAGAIIALGLASGMSAREVRELYEQLGRDVFKKRLPLSGVYHFARAVVTSRHDNSALKEALESGFKNLTLGDLKAKGKFALVTAFNLSNGRPRIFKTDHAPELTRDDGYLLRDVALASAAAPVFFPIVPLVSPTTGIRELFCDGGVYANHPALLGYIEAIHMLRQRSSDVSILSISTPRGDLAEHESSRGWLARQEWFQRYLIKRGVFLWGSQLANTFIDSTSIITDEILKRLSTGCPGGEFPYVRIMLPKPPGLEMDVATAATTSTLKRIGI